MLQLLHHPITLTFLFAHLTSHHLTTAQSIGDRINQFDPQWHCNVDSWESTDEDCDKAIDSNDNTYWHSQYNPTDEPLPHHITIDMGKLHAVRSLTYLPRQDGSRNGNIGNWRITLFADPDATPDPDEVAKSINGTWRDDQRRKTVAFETAVMARYVRLTALSEAGRRGPWTSVCQIDIYEDNGSEIPNPPNETNASPDDEGGDEDEDEDEPRNRNGTSPNLVVINGKTVTPGGTMTLGPRPTGGAMGGY
ncbi:MAG: hypothetical protein Q9169_008326, partial [Polycauliona sp. 2 TL-2023]